MSFKRMKRALFVVGIIMVIVVPALSFSVPQVAGERSQHVFQQVSEEQGADSEVKERFKDGLYEELDRVIDRLTYSEYEAMHLDQARPEREIVIDAASFSGASSDVRMLEHFEEMEGVSVWTDEEGWIEWEVHVPEAGLYHISMLYYSVEGKSSEIQRSLLINGELPFAEAGYLQFYRVWTNLHDQIRKDNQGHHLRPEQTERPQWQEQIFRDLEGFYEQPFSFYFPAGKNTITLVAQREPIVIRQLRLHQMKEVPSYAERLETYEKSGIPKTNGHVVVVQGEDASAKSSPTLYPLADRSSPNVDPYHPAYIRINSIGGHNWRMPGQWIEWEFDVPESGLYKIAFNVKQDFVRGVFSTRKLTINGQLPFKEAEELVFPYASGFRIVEAGEGEPYLFYLEKGKNVLRLEAHLGQLAPLIREVETSLLRINAMYRKVLMITGTSPDRFRDYQIERKLPELTTVFREESERLNRIAEQMKELGGSRSDREAVLLTMADQLADLADRPETLPRRLDDFKINAGGLGTWLLQVREMPLQIDSIVIASPDEKVPMEDAGWAARMWHEFKRFAYSFVIDYNAIGNMSDENAQRSITVWIGSGRDQAQTIKAMIDETFTPQTGINVDLKLVQMHHLLPATLAGEGPDVAMQVGNDVPVNYALRNAAVNLAQFPDFEEVAQRFRPSALVPYHFDGGYYALPETQTFDMMFYRKDILQELGLNPPETWQDVYHMLSVLSKHHLEFGLPLVVQPQYPGQNLPPNSVYAALLYQNGGAFYRNEDKESDLDSEIGIRVFKEWTEFYTDFKLEREFDFANRLRTGEMPIGLADYTMYNQLTVFAPEIRGLWGFAPIPGTRQPDGSIRRDVASMGMAVLMLEKAKDKEAAWEFMKWWTSEETQVKFGREMEGLMGAAARWPTANKAAFEQLPWPVADLNQLKEQFQYVRGIPEVPGGYFTGRHLTNAFYKTVVGQVEPKESLMDYVQYIHEEITFKRNEFGLPTD